MKRLDFRAALVSTVEKIDARNKCSQTMNPTILYCVLPPGVYSFMSFLLSICYYFPVCRSLGQTHLLTSFGRAVAFLKRLGNMCGCEAFAKH